MTMLTTFAVTYILGGERNVLTVQAEDRDDAYDRARSELVRLRLYSAAIQGTARAATPEDVQEHCRHPMHDDDCPHACEAV